MEKKIYSNLVILLVILLVSTAFSIFLQKELGIKEFREAQVASTSQIYWQQGIDLLRPQLNVIAGEGYFALEFPLYQAMVAALWEVGDLGIIWGNILSHGFWIFGSVILYLLNRDFLKLESRVNLISIFLFSFAPLSLLYMHSVGIEAFSFFLLMSFLYPSLKWACGGGVNYYLLFFLISCLGFVIKLPAIATFYLMPLVFLLRKERIVWSRVALLCFAAFFSTIVTATWQIYAQDLNSLENKDYYPDGNSIEWFLGTLEMRLNPFVYGVILAKATENSFGGIWGICLLILSLSQLNRKNLVIVTYVACYVAAVLLFINLHFKHIHYTVPFVHIFAVLAALVLNQCYLSIIIPLRQNLTTKDSWMNPFIVFGFSITLSLGYIVNSGRYLDYRGFIYDDQDLDSFAGIIQEHTHRSDNIALYWQRGTGGGTWDPLLMYLSDRKGRFLYIDDLEEGNFVEIQKSCDCTYLVIAGDFLRFAYHEAKTTTQMLRGRNLGDAMSPLKIDLPETIWAKLEGLTSIYDSQRLKIYKLPKLTTTPDDKFTWTD